jgi:alanine racemase
VVRCTTARVDLSALESNFNAISSYLHNETKLNRGAGRGPALAPAIIAVVKANAYGHGARRVAETLEKAGAIMLAVADIEEGVDLRKSGINAPILIFGALSVSDLDGVFEHRLTPTISSPATGEALQAGAAKRHATLHYHLKIDTGMNRLGFRHDNLQRTQRQRFDVACKTIDDLGAGPRLRHAANSAALLRDSRVWFDFVRPGLLLYGVVPPPLGSNIELKPVMSLTSRVVATKGVRVGETVGYGGRFAADRPVTLAVIPAGYADGLDRRLENHGYVLIRGRRARIVGAVSMDMLTADITDIEGVGPGDEVVFLGSQGDEPQQTIDAREMAAWIGTIPYEILCRLGARVERRYN